MTHVHVIAHTHWDREWYLTREQYRVRLVDLLDRVLDRMAVEPEFTYFHLDGQTIVLGDYLEVRPEREAELRALVRSGRVLVGPWYVMPDMFLVSGESIVRNIALGLRIAEQFGRAMRVGYMPDPFGHLAQMPQILAGFGLDGAILWRGFGGTGSEYLWEAPDGTRALLLHLPREGYCNGLGLPLLPPDRMRVEARAVVEREAARSTCGQVLLMVGVDHVEPPPGLLRFVDVINDGPGVVARLSTLPDYVDAVRNATEGTRDALGVVRGELRAGQEYAHLLPGVFSARTYLKQANARAQRELERWSEPLSVFAFLCGVRGSEDPRLRHDDPRLRHDDPRLRHDDPQLRHDDPQLRDDDARLRDRGSDDPRLRYDDPRLHDHDAHAIRGLLRYAWRTLLENHPHDSICGCSIDAVHDENMTRFARAQQAADIVTYRSARAIADLLAPPPAGALRAVAINTDAHAWAGVLETTIEVPLEAAPQDREVDPSQLEEPLEYFGPAASVTTVTGARGQALAFQVLGEEDAISHRMGRYVLPAAVRVRRVRLAIDVDDVPAFGYAALDVHVASPSEAPMPGASARAWCDERAIENELVRVEVREDGAVDVRDKTTGAIYRRVFAFEDVGDVGDEYNYSPPASDVRVTNGAAKDVRVRPVGRGPLCASVLIELTLPVPVSATADRGARSEDRVGLPIALELRVHAGSGMVEGIVRLENRARDHRLRLLFPTGATMALTHRADTAFGVVERRVDTPPPAGDFVETPVGSAPMQSFVDAGDAATGAIVVTDGLVEYEVTGGDGSDAIVGVTLVRAVGDLSRNDLSTRRGHAGPGLPTPGAQCPGPHEFRIAFVPRGAAPSGGQLFAVARGFLAPPRIFAPCGGSGRLEPVGTFVRLGAQPRGEVVLSAFKRADAGDDVVVRVFNLGDEASTLTIALSAPVRAAHHADLSERHGEACVVTEDGVALTVGPQRIETVMLRVGFMNARAPITHNSGPESSES